MKDARVSSLAIDAANPAIVWAGRLERPPAQRRRREDLGRHDARRELREREGAGARFVCSGAGLCRDARGTACCGPPMRARRGRAPGPGFWSFDVTGVVERSVEPPDRLGLDERRRRLQDHRRRRDLGPEERGDDGPLGPLPALRCRRRGLSLWARATTCSRARTAPRSGRRQSRGWGARRSRRSPSIPSNPKRLYARDDFYFHSSDDGGHDLDAVEGRPRRQRHDQRPLRADGRSGGARHGLHERLPPALEEQRRRQRRSSRAAPGLPLERVEVILADPGVEGALSPAPRARGSTSRPTAARAGRRATPASGP